MNDTDPNICIEQRNNILIVTINRPTRRNAVNADTAERLYQIFLDFENSDDLSVAVLTGANGNFCAGADLKAISEGDPNKVTEDGPMGPMGPSRLRLSKPVIAAIEGYAVAGGLELALWADMRVASDTAILGVFCRRFGVPMIDGGSVRLPRLIGQSRAMDMFLTGRSVPADEALSFGLVNRVVPQGEALETALNLAAQISEFPQTCLRNDRQSLLEQWGLKESDALNNEVKRGLATMRSGETVSGATLFAKGTGRHGQFGT